MTERVDVAPSPHPDSSFLLPLAIATAVGAALRVRQLGGQLIGDDEWHAVHLAAGQTFGYVLTHFRDDDNSIPLTLIYKAMLESVGLSEWGLHGFPLAAGLISIPVLGLAVRAALGRAPALIFAACFAISPLLIYYSRYARPYIFVACLGFGALMALYLWIRSPQRQGPALLYLVSTSLAGWFSPPSLPALLAPLGILLPLALHSAWKHRPSQLGELPGPLRLATLLFGTCIAIACWLLPPVATSASILRKVGAGFVDLATLRGLLELFSGTGHFALSLAMLAVTTLGAAALYRAHRLLFALLATAVVSQYFVLCLLRPQRLQMAVVMARYSIVCLPIFLLCFSLGLDHFARLLARWAGGLKAALPRFRVLHWLVPVLALAALLLAGPLPGTLYATNSFVGHDAFQYGYDQTDIEPSASTLAALPAFYERLAAEPGEAPVIEFPQPLWWSGLFYHRYQRIHGRPVLLGHPAASLVIPIQLRHPGLKLRNHIGLDDPRAVLRSGASHLIIHKDIANESLFLKHLDRGGAARDFLQPPPGEHAFDQRYGPLSRKLAVKMIASYRRGLGPPVYEDRWIAAFALDRGDKH